MGFFSRKPSLEQQLREIHIPLLQRRGMSLSQADEVFSTWLQQAKEEAEKEGTANMPQNFGDLILQSEATDDPMMPTRMAKVRRAGATDEDIRNWWNCHDLERRIMLKDDELTRIAIATDQLHKLGATKENWKELAEKAAVHARKACPFWGDPDDSTHASGDDRPLPEELKFRINGWIQRRAADPDGFKKDLEQSSSFNALVRKEMAKGNL